MNDEIMTRTQAGRWGKAEEIAGTAIYLASRASQFVTGETVRVDVGYAIRRSTGRNTRWFRRTRRLHRRSFAERVRIGV